MAHSNFNVLTTIDEAVLHNVSSAAIVCRRIFLSGNAFDVAHCDVLTLEPNSRIALARSLHEAYSSGRSQTTVGVYLCVSKWSVGEPAYYEENLAVYLS